ncbi:peptide methionine sulfoxide reductase MsrA [Pedobacter glucosidilyticus]|uniref:Peptide methionine sulfoxide reductase MsrA n=1 Tax=Pedobacter aquae TaxID=2605747 RepID=A0A5C0VNN0_9SPHI|nr:MULTISPECIES: peptide-methionine (S)-S-oxide reductase MsrA [Pedobacter]KHJ39466.1 peptide methionine sulfoxide reductase MsrA [Pedobacter glucosidilyticus]QEK53141.1 peptide-methionine (S)-S-oxide reductase MsrA [Pedobacter aquae]
MTRIITLGGGCFWCTEAVFIAINGITDVKPGYMGGERENPSYEQVCSGATGHAEVIQITYDDEVLSLEELLYVFFYTHNPTTLNRQGADVGTQYRSVIFYEDAQQAEIAHQVIAKINEEEVYTDKIVTEVSLASVFYVAEDYHHQYFIRNRNQPYCMAVIEPKLVKLLKSFKDKIKPELL